MGNWALFISQFFNQVNLFLERLQVVSFCSKKGFQSFISSLENPILSPRSRSLHFPPQLQESIGDMEFSGEEKPGISMASPPIPMEFVVSLA